MTDGYPRPLAALVNDLKDELKDSAATRLAMLRSEMNEKLSSLKSAVPALVVGLFFLLTAWLVFTGFLVTAIALAFSTPWGWAWAFLIVAGAYLLLGGVLASTGRSKLKRLNLVPERTLRVLKQDEIWLESEAGIHP